MGLDPESIFRRTRPKVVRGKRGRPSRRRIVGYTLLGIFLLIFILGGTSLGLRVQYLFLSTMGHSNVFWTPVIAQLVLFLIAFVIAGGLTALNIPAWRAAARCLDERGGRIAVGAGIAVALAVGIFSGIYLSSQWQDVLLWMHGKDFGAIEPVFGKDYSFFVFTLPVIDMVQGIAWGIVLISLLTVLGMSILAGAAINAPVDVPLPLRPAPGKSPESAIPILVRHGGALLVLIFILAALGAHFTVFHMTTSAHDQYNFVGLDATQRNVVRPVLGISQWVDLVFAVGIAALLIARWNDAKESTGGVFTGIVALFLIGSAIAQNVPSLIYDAAYAKPNAQTAQANKDGGPIADFLAASRYAWALQDGTDIDVKKFGATAAPTLADLAADPGTLRNVRLQDAGQLDDTLAQIDRTRNYQVYPNITVDRYATAAGDQLEVMLGPREIDSNDVPGGFVNQNLIYTHGYGVTAVSVNKIGDSGKPYVLTGQQPMHQVATDSPPDLSFAGVPGADPRIFCGESMDHNVVVNTTQGEFDYPSGTGDQTSHAGDITGIPLDSAFDKLALSLVSYGGTDLLLTNTLTPDSRALLHRGIADRVQTLAPFLTVDKDPYVVVDPTSKHLVYIVDAYVSSDRFPDSFRLDDGTSYKRNAVKAVVDAKTCATTLYALDMNEPMTAAYNAIYPGLMTPFDQMPMAIKAHLRYPEDLLTNQAKVYATVHVADASVFFNGSDRYRVSQELSETGTPSDTAPYYIIATLPGDAKPTFMLLQTFSPGSGSGSGGTANNMTAWLAAQCDYTKTNHPLLAAVPLDNGANVLGPLQFDNNLNTNQAISSTITLLGQHGSKAILGNVIVLPFNNHTFLYVRPLYVAASSGSGSSFPQLQEVLVGTQNAVAQGPTFAAALQNLFNTKDPIPGLDSTGTPTPTPTPTPGPGPGPGQTVSPEVIAVVNDLIAHQAAAHDAFTRGDFATYGKEQDAIQADIDKLKQLLAAPQATPSATPSASPG